MPQLARNVGSMYVPRIAGIVAGLFLFPFVVGHVGLSQSGLWLLISSTTVFFAQDFGMGVSLIRYVADSRARGDTAGLNRVVCSTLGFFCTVGLLAAGAFAVVMTLLLPGLNVAERDHDVALAMIGLVAGGQLLVGMPLGVFRGVLAGAERYPLLNTVAFGQIIVRCAAIVVLLESGAGIVGVAAAEAAVAVAAGITYMFLSRRVVPELEIRRRHARVAVVRDILPYSLQVFAIGTAALLILHADNLIIGMFLPIGMVALYASAFRLYQVCRDLAGSLLQPLVPDASRAAATGARPRLQRVLLDGTKYSNALVLCIAVPMLIFAGPILSAWVGPRFEDVDLVAQVLIVGFLVNNNHLVAMSLLTGMGRIGRYVRYHAIWAGANVVLSIALIQWLELVGVALATTLPLLLLEPLYVRVALRELDLTAGVFVRRCIAPTALPALVATVPLVALVLVADPRSVGSVLSASLFYASLFGVVFYRWGLSVQERHAVTATLRRLRQRATGSRAPLGEASEVVP